MTPRLPSTTYTWRAQHSASSTDKPLRFISAQLAAYPDLLNRYLVAKILMAIYTTPPVQLSAPKTDNSETLKRCRFSFAERITWSEPLRGTIPLTDKEIADNLAIGGLRNAADSVDRLHLVKQYGIKLGDAFRKLLRGNTEDHAKLECRFSGPCTL